MHKFHKFYEAGVPMFQYSIKLTGVNTPAPYCKV